MTSGYYSYDWYRRITFKPMGRTPVAGGRWGVRKSQLSKTTKRWRASSRGTAQRWSRSFRTHGEAVAWAQLVAWAYVFFGKQRADVILAEFKSIGRETALKLVKK